MLDYQRIVDDVRNTLYTATVEGIDFMRAAAADYLVACEETNERLRRCGGFLKQGLRSEAIQLAEIEPVLLDVVATLDFPEREQWCEAVARFGIIAPAPLLIEVAAELNEAYAQEQPLAVLLARHRLLALAHSPLPLRINVLRRLAELDASNPVWHDDLAVYERERQKQLQKLLADAAQTGDIATLAALDEELHQPWIEMPAAALLNWSAETRARIGRRAARAELERVEVALNDAFSNLDPDAAREFREQWQGLASMVGLTPDDPLANRAAPALEWLVQQDEHDAAEADHQAAISALSKALKHGEPRETLEKLHRAVKRGGYDLPTHLEQLYRNRLAAIDSAAVRRWRLIAVSIIAATLMSCTGIGLAAYWIVHTQQASAKIAALTKLINAGKFAQADDYIAELAQDDAGLASSLEFSSESKRLKDLKQQDAERRQAFEAAMGAAAAASLDRPDDVALHRAENLARTDAERARILDLRAKSLATSSDLRQQHEKKFSDDLKQLDTRVTELEKSRDHNRVERDKAIQSLRTDFVVLDGYSESLAEDLRNQLRPLSARLDALAADAGRAHQLDEHVRAVIQAVGDRDRYRVALQAYTTTFPNDARAADYGRVLKEATLWNEVEAWNEFVVRWDEEATKALDIEKAKNLAKAIKDFCDQHPRWPRNDALLQRVPYLQAIVRRVAEDQSLFDSVDKLFKDALVTDLWMVELKDGRRYYSRTAPIKTNTGMVQFKYLTGFDFAEKPRGIKDIEVQRFIPAPQNTLGKQATHLLTQFKDDTWENSFSKIIQVLLKPESDGPETDPLLKLALLKQTMEIATKGSYCLECGYEQQLKLLKNSKVSAITNWLDPDDAEANTSRPQAAREIKALQSVALSDKAVAERQAVLHSPLGKTLDWIGLLQRTTDGAWECPTSSPPPISGKLVVITASGDKVTLPVVGRATAQRLEISGLGATLLDGRPVYLIAP